MQMRFILRYGTWFLVFCLAAVTLTASAQEAPKKFFIYIQNQSGTPFYLRSADSLLSSTPSGYLIVPGLTKGSYHFTVGFPRNEAPEASFNIVLDGSGDKGYLLRKGDQGLLNLYALRDFKPLKPTAVASAPGNRIVDVPEETPEVSPTAKPKKESSEVAVEPPAPVPATPQADTLAAATAPPSDDTDAFSRMLNEITGTTAAASPAPSVPQPSAQSQQPASPGISPQEPAKQPVETPQKGLTESPASVEPVGQTTDHTSDTAVPPAAQASEQQPQFLTFQTDSAPPETHPADTLVIGQLAAVDSEEMPEAADTAAAARRREKKLRREARRREKDAALDVAPVTQQADIAVSPMDNEPVEDQAGASPVQDDAGMPANTGDKKPLKMNSDCQHMASSEDFQKIRRKMASRSDEGGMFRIAEKYLTGGDCFQTEQIQSLTYLFLTDQYKYKFLELAYPHTADPAHFSKLEKTLGTDYYRKRFEAMIR